MLAFSSSARASAQLFGDELAAVVIDHDDQVTVAALVGDLVDPDPT